MNIGQLHLDPGQQFSTISAVDGIHTPDPLSNMNDQESCLQRKYPDAGLLYNTIVKQILYEHDSELVLHTALITTDGELGAWPDLLQSLAFICRVRSPGGTTRYAVYCSQAHDKALKGNTISLDVMPDTEKSKLSQPADVLYGVWRRLQEA
ncbi:hypothetical protein EIP91_003436, partial [Steccherinum ochraceum]